MTNERPIIPYQHYQATVARHLAIKWGNKNSFICVRDYLNIVEYQWRHAKSPNIAANLIDYVIMNKSMKMKDYVKPLDLALNGKEVRKTNYNNKIGN